MPWDITVRNEPELNRYVILKDDEQVGFTEYHLHDDEIDFYHTEIDPERRETGLASILVQTALDDVRDAQRSAPGRVVPVRAALAARASGVPRPAAPLTRARRGDRMRSARPAQRRSMRILPSKMPLSSSPATGAGAGSIDWRSISIWAS